MPADKIIEAHGSFSCQHCIECKHIFPSDKMRRAISDRCIPHCETPQCNGLVKPDIVFFGEPLPEDFHQNKYVPREADLCIVMGTSLSVQPFASLPGFCADGVPRLLVNLERVGGLGSRADDVLLLGDCDVGIQKLIAALGWSEELESAWRNTKLDMGGTRETEEHDRSVDDQSLDDKMSKLTEEIDRSLKISNGHANMLGGYLDEKQEEQPSKFDQDDEDCEYDYDKAASLSNARPPRTCEMSSHIVPGGHTKAATSAGNMHPPFEAKVERTSLQESLAIASRDLE